MIYSNIYCSILLDNFLYFTVKLFISAMRAVNLPPHILDRVAILSDDYYTAFYMNRSNDILFQMNSNSFSNLLRKPYTDTRLLRKLMKEFDIELFDPRMALGNKRCLKILIRAGMPLSLDNFQLKTKSGRLIRSPNDSDIPLDTQLFEAAATVGKLKIMRLLLKNGCKFDVQTFIAAAKQGKLNNIKWLHKHGCPCNPKVFSAALECGRLENVIWLFKICPIGGAREFACEMAAKSGNLPLLTWLVNNKFQLDAVVLERAAWNGDVAMVKFLTEHGCEIDSQVAYAAGKSGVINFIRLVHLKSEHLFLQMIDGAVENGHLAAKNWLIMNGYTPTSSTIEIANFSQS